MRTRVEQKRIFTVSSNEGFLRYVRDNLPDGDFVISGTALTCTEARQKMMSETGAIILINLPLSDECGTELAADFAERLSVTVIAFVKKEQEQEFRQSMEPSGVFVLGKPFAHEAFHQALFDAAAANARMVSATLENARLQEKLADLRVVNRAKYALMQYLGMTESEAHKHIEQAAMNQRISKRQAAENILKTYANL